MNNTRPIAIEAGTLFTPGRKYSPGRVIIEGNSIAASGHADDVSIPSSAELIDARPFLVTPGFIDPHVHGCRGADAMDGSWASLNTISQNLARHGTTTFLPTTVSSPPEVLTGAIVKLSGLLHKPLDGARPIGIHLEGPFINPEKRGTHKASYVHAPDVTLFRRWLEESQGSLRLVTLAPELKGAEEIIRAANAAGVTMAMGHSDATYQEATAATDLGVRYAVHTFNAMRAFAHRDPGIAGAVLSDDRVFAEIIADGIHVDPAVVRIFARSKKAGRILLATDAISATDMPDGSYTLGTDNVTVTSGVCRDSEGRLAGSTLTQEKALRNLLNWGALPFEDALLGLTQNPAQALQLHGKGLLEPGADADIVILDRDLSVLKTFVGGRLVFEK